MKHFRQEIADRISAMSEVLGTEGLKVATGMHEEAKELEFLSTYTSEEDKKKAEENLSKIAARSN